MWILGSARFDLLFLTTPALTGLAIALAFPQLGETSLVYGFVATAVLDSGHVYTTAWRTYLHGPVFKETLLYWFTPLAFLLLFWTWSFTKLPGLWSFVIYSTLYHHIRQTYGLSKWYQTLNRRSDPLSDRFLYTLSLLPVLMYHFREGVIGGYYSNADLFLHPHAAILNALSAIYGLILLAWMGYEIHLYGRGVREPNRLLSVALPALVYGYCFLLGQTFTQVLFPLLITHGSAYIAIMATSLNRTQKERFKTPLVALLVLLLTALVFGLTESWIEESTLGDEYEGQSLLRSFLIALTLTPLYCHYVFDALIWKKTHPEASAIFSSR